VCVERKLIDLQPLMAQITLRLGLPQPSLPRRTHPRSKSPPPPLFSPLARGLVDSLPESSWRRTFWILPKTLWQEPRTRHCQLSKHLSSHSSIMLLTKLAPPSSSIVPPPDVKCSPLHPSIPRPIEASHSLASSPLLSFGTPWKVVP
jgi:hypothetical protein